LVLFYVKIETQGIYVDSYTTIKRGSTDPCQADIDKVSDF
jgi:hypothetical protein